ncbi:MAG: hypothetical protein NC311_06495 [Muribaculaceae bacterium]|nr:hypothetical protein [Muribaculaceae bacterium]
MALSSGAEFICNVAQRLFYMVPGTDSYNRDMGLDITTRAKRPYQDGFRDSDYEQDVLKQFLAYTDIIPSAVVAIYQDKLLIVTMLAKYNGEEFTLRASSDPNRLATQILPKNVEPKPYANV